MEQHRWVAVVAADVHALGVAACELLRPLKNLVGWIQYLQVYATQCRQNSDANDKLWQREATLSLQPPSLQSFSSRGSRNSLLRDLLLIFGAGVTVRCDAVL